MIPLDGEIVEVERRIALRRERLKMRAREAGARARQALASPAALIGAAAVGFVAARALAARQQKPPQPGRRKSDHPRRPGPPGIAGVDPARGDVVRPRAVGLPGARRSGSA